VVPGPAAGPVPVLPPPGRCRRVTSVRVYLVTKGAAEIGVERPQAPLRAQAEDRFLTGSPRFMAKG
jgi:hypothetical protein